MVDIVVWVEEFIYVMFDWFADQDELEAKEEEEKKSR